MWCPIFSYFSSSSAEVKRKEGVSVRVWSGAGHQKPGVQSKGWHTSPRCTYSQEDTQSIHTCPQCCNPRGVLTWKIELIDCGFRGGGECYNDRREWSSGWGSGIPFWQTQVSDSVSAYDKNSKLGLGPGIAPHSLSQAFLFFFFVFPTALKHRSVLN